jgi:pseudouridine synthase
MAVERLQKILAQVGITSRRKAEELIVEGLVTVNGKVAKLGDKAALGKDAIKVKGKLILHAEAATYLAFYKPKGVISALADPESRPTLKEFLSKVRTRVFPVGRLDFNSEGLILLTNDGDLAEKIQKNDDVYRIYTVKVKGHPDVEMMSRLEKGIHLSSSTHPTQKRYKKRLLKPESAQVIKKLEKKTIIEVVIRGSGAFDIKSLFEMRGFLVEKIVRTAIGHLTLKGLRPGHYRHLKTSQVKALLDQPELGLKSISPQLPKKIKDKRFLD